MSEISYSFQTSSPRAVSIHGHGPCLTSLPNNRWSKIIHSKSKQTNIGPQMDRSRLAASMFTTRPYSNFNLPDHSMKVAVTCVSTFQAAPVHWSAQAARRLHFLWPVFFFSHQEMEPIVDEWIFFPHSPPIGGHNNLMNLRTRTEISTIDVIESRLLDAEAYHTLPRIRSRKIRKGCGHEDRITWNSHPYVVFLHRGWHFSETEGYIQPIVSNHVWRLKIDWWTACTKHRSWHLQKHNDLFLSYLL